MSTIPSHQDFETINAQKYPLTRAGRADRAGETGGEIDEQRDLLLNRLIEGLGDRLVNELRPNDPRDKRTVAEIVELYLAAVEDEIGDRTYEDRQFVLTLFAEAHGSKRVADCLPLMVKEFIDTHPAWVSGWTKARVNRGIQRAFNWALENRLIRENPFAHGVRLSGDKSTGRDMSREEFQALMRHAPRFYKRFLLALKLTGARPGELCRMQWSDIRWHQGIAVLAQHKTVKKTGKPRVIILVPAMVKLLAIMHRDRRPSVAMGLCQLFQTSGEPVMDKGQVIAYRMNASDVIATLKRHFSCSHTAIQHARKKLGVTGQCSPGGKGLYELPAGNVVQSHGHVFVGANQQPLKKGTICTLFGVLRKKLGLPKDCSLYGLRHFYLTDGVRRGIPTQTLAALAGHTSARMIEAHYNHIASDHAFLHQAAALVTGLKQQPTPLDLPAEKDDPASPECAKAEYAKVTAKEKRPRKFPDRFRLAYELYQLAVDQEPALLDGTDTDVFAWLVKRPEYREQLPATANAFRTYLTNARIFLNGKCSDERRREVARKAVTKRWSKPK